MLNEAMCVCNIAIQVKECKNDVIVLPICRTPGSFRGSQFKLTNGIR